MSARLPNGVRAIAIVAWALTASHASAGGRQILATTTSDSDCKIVTLAVGDLIAREQLGWLSVGSTAPQTKPIDMGTSTRSPRDLDQDLIQAFERRGQARASESCPQLDALLARHNASVDRAGTTVDAHRTKAPDAELRIGRPLIAADGRSAMVTVELHWMSWRGAGETFILKALQDRWQIFASVNQWHSSEATYHPRAAN